MSDNSSPTVTFKDLALSEALLKALDEVGYETPSPVQAATIPVLLEGSDIVGQAQTGSGKTAAFALPMLSRIDLKKTQPQLLVLTPTRELAIQVAEAFQRYASHMRGFHVLPIYGGQDYKIQLRALRRGVHVIVGTPGRVIDHLRKGTLKLDQLKALVLDEADEMLRMGFIDDVEWVLEQTPPTRQIALFSATMPKDIRRIARKHLKNPQEISIKQKTATAETIRQRYWMVSGTHKLDALTRILEAETLDATLIFVRTKIATVELAEKLEARGYAVAPLSGDIQQKQRERTVDQLKRGKLDIVVATDVAARGLDVQRISHVINFDVPHDTESYIHRIGRTGRAGREGDAILFIAPREKRMLYAIEKATRKKIDQMQLPSTADINDKRIVQFKQNITDAIAAEEENGFYLQLVEQYHQEHNVPAIDPKKRGRAMVREHRAGMLEEKIHAAKGGEETGRMAVEIAGGAAGKMAAEKAEITRSGLPRAGAMSVPASVGSIRHRGLLKAWSVSVWKLGTKMTSSPEILSALLPMKPASTASTSTALSFMMTTQPSSFPRECPGISFAR